MIIIILLYSIVQAATEFFPISSSGHLVLLHQVVPLSGVDPLAFDVALHWGTLFAVCCALWKDLGSLFRGLLHSVRTRSLSANTNGRLAWFLLLGNVVPIAVGAVLGGWVEDHTRNTNVVVSTLILGALLLFVADRVGQRQRTLRDVTLLDALYVGASQIIAFVPGISRSGISIITALFRNLNREAAVRLSFLLSIPIIAAAGIKELIDLLTTQGWGSSGGMLALGFVCSAVFGYGVIRFFLRFVARHSFATFAYYRIVIALVMLLFL